jgi:hypothetical protein
VPNDTRKRLTGLSFGNSKPDSTSNGSKVSSAVGLDWTSSTGLLEMEEFSF